jgi:Ca-activated chloride channel family protein
MLRCWRRYIPLSSLLATVYAVHATPRHLIRNQKTLASRAAPLHRVDMPHHQTERVRSMRVASPIISSLIAASLSGQAFAQEVAVDHPVEACPAFDVIRHNALNYARGNIETEGGNASQGNASVAVEFILDASGSMAGRVGGEIKMEVARDAFNSAIGALDGSGAVASLRAYGFDASVEKTPEASCPNTVLMTDFQADASGEMVDAANGLSPYGYTPIAASLTAAGEDLSGVEAEHRLIVLLSDGEETCGGDPVEAARELHEMDLDLSTFVVGFDLAAEQASQMRAIAEAGGGRYMDAPDAQSLQDTMREIVNVTIDNTTRRIDRCENPLQGGATPQEATLIEPGIYTVGELLDVGEYRYYRVATREGELATIHGLVQTWRYVDADNDEDMVESQHGLASMTVRILDNEGERAGSRDPRLAGRPGEFGTGYYSDISGDGFVIGIGDNYEHVNPFALFSVEVHEVMDGDTGADADDDRNGDLATLDIGASATGYIGYDDVADSWRVGSDGLREAMSITVAPINMQMRYMTLIYDGTTGRRLVRHGQRGEASFDIPAGTGPVIVRLQSQEPGLAPLFTAYTLSAGVAESLEQ